MATQIINPEMDVLISSVEQLKTDIQTLHTPLAAMPAGITELQERALAAYATDTASGTIANFPDGADDIPVKSATFAIEPIQDLNGYDSPWPAGGGKNKLPNTLEDGVSSGVTFKTNADGTISASGTTQASSVYRPLCSNFALTPSTSYILNGNSGNAQIRIREYDSGGNLLATTTTSSSAESTFTVNASTDRCDAYLIAYGNIGSTVNLTYKPMLRLSTVSDATFEPYSNICPISGWDGANVTRTGKNLFDASIITSGNRNRRVSTANGGTYTSNGYSVTDLIFVKAGTYTLTIGSTSYYAQYDLNRAFLTGGGWGNSTSRSFESDCYIRFDYPTDNEGIVQLELGSTATTYEPYTATTIHITWSEAGTVYGGTLEYLGGESWRLTRTMAVDTSFALNEISTIQTVGDYTRFWLYTIGKTKGPVICNILPTAAGNSSYSAQRAEIYGADPSYPQSYWAKIPTSLCGTTAAEIKAYLDSVGLQVAYTLATPQTYDLTADELRTLLGTNNVWADTGSAEVEYRADTALYIAKKIAEAQG